MKSRKASQQQKAEDRNALYNKVIQHNKELAQKNTALSQKITYLENNLDIVYGELLYVTRKRWWQFWK